MELKLPTSSQGASRANRSRSQANKKERVMTDISGLRCFALSRHSNRGSLLARMCEELLTSKTAWSSKLCALTWKVKDTKCNRSIFQLQVSALPIEEKESGSLQVWRTPDAHCNRGPSSEKRMKMKLEKGMPISINDQVAHPNLMWPTPTQDSATDRSKKYSQGGTPLTLAVKEQQMWPTPNARDWKDSINKVPPSVGKTRGHTLGMKVAETRQQEQQMWPTPRAALGMTFTLSQGMANLRYKKYLETEVAYQEKAPGGTLNPMWVEWLMGYPAGYTDLKDWAILSSRKSPKKSVKPSSKRKK